MSDHHDGMKPELLAVIDHLYAMIDNDPKVLLEQPGGPVGMTADFIVARLMGHDDQVAHQMVLLSPLRTVRTPRHNRPTLGGYFGGDPADAQVTSVRSDEWVLMSGYSTANFAPEPCMALGLPMPTAPNFLTTVLCLRYRRADLLPPLSPQQENPKP